MSRPESLSRIIVGLCAVWLMTGGTHASDVTGESTTFQPRKFNASVRSGEIVGREQVRRVFVTCGTNEFVFAIPMGLRVDVTANKVTLISDDTSYFLSFRIVLPVENTANASGADPYRQHLLDQFPDARILEEFSQSAAGRSGPAFEIRWKPEAGHERAVRTALIPSGAGFLELSLNADVSKVAVGRSASSYLMRTFQSNERGALVIVSNVIDRS